MIDLNKINNSVLYYHFHAIIMNIFFSQEALNQAQPTSDIRWRGSERKRQRLVVAEMEERMGRVFSSYGAPLMELPPFKDLGRIIFSTDDD